MSTTEILFVRFTAHSIGSLRSENTLITQFVNFRCQLREAVSRVVSSAPTHAGLPRPRPVFLDAIFQSACHAFNALLRAGLRLLQLFVGEIGGDSSATCGAASKFKLKTLVGSLSLFNGLRYQEPMCVIGLFLTLNEKPSFENKSSRDGESHECTGTRHGPVLSQCPPCCHRDRCLDCGCMSALVQTKIHQHQTWNEKSHERAKQTSERNKHGLRALRKKKKILERDQTTENDRLGVALPCAHCHVIKKEYSPQVSQ